MFIDEDEDVMMRFYTDATNASVFGTPVSYLDKYESIQDYSIVIHSENEVLRILYGIVARELDKPSKIADYIAQLGIEPKINPVLAGVFANKYPDIRRELLRKEICRGSPCLLDHNWRVLNIMATNWTAFGSRILLSLTLIIEQGACAQQKRISLQLDVHQLEQLINKLKEIKKALRT